MESGQQIYRGDSGDSNDSSVGDIPIELPHLEAQYIYLDSKLLAFFCSGTLISFLTVNVSCVLPKSLRTHPHVVENRGITMAPLLLRLIS